MRGYHLLPFQIATYIRNTRLGIIPILFEDASHRLEEMLTSQNSDHT